VPAAEEGGDGRHGAHPGRDEEGPSQAGPEGLGKSGAEKCFWRGCVPEPRPAGHAGLVRAANRAAAGGTRATSSAGAAGISACSSPEARIGGKRTARAAMTMLKNSPMLGIIAAF
jgi:hypothetical protein